MGWGVDSAGGKSGGKCGVFWPFRGLDCVLGLDSLADGYLGFWF